ncbi:two-component signal transduction [Rhodopirellula islandica]|uniref:histidine kinase n=1 Tax=Rhodopirellula islandica TaxID=595434 RepID=A0A0J1BFG4_RHOIS|nr:ATP-binding protein [Rhodopirellula islandica]KLU05246.1 two-component signal transduction [Rhodopirellula islandica]
MHIEIDPLRNNRLARVMMEASPVAIVLSNTSGVIEAINHVAEGWFGYEEKELISQKLDLILEVDSTSDDASHTSCRPARSSDLERRQPTLRRGHRRDGSSFLAQTSVFPLTSDWGETRWINLIDVCRDQAGVEDADVNPPAVDHLIEGERLAAVLQMATGLAHESSNALQRAQSCLDLLRLDLTHRGELLELTDQIKVALNDLHRNHEEVKHYAAPIVLKRSPVNLNELCQQQFKKLVQPIAEECPRMWIEIAAGEAESQPSKVDSKADTCPLVHLDVNRIGEVLRRVLENAIHASSPGGRIAFECDCSPSTESLSSEWKSIDASPILLRVRDHGSGLTEEVQTRMFEPFFTTKQRGAGLGLSVCRRIVKAHGGTIAAANHPDGGTVVQIILPR